MTIMGTCVDPGRYVLTTFWGFLKCWPESIPLQGQKVGTSKGMINAGVPSVFVLLVEDGMLRIGFYSRFPTTGSATRGSVVLSY